MEEVTSRGSILLAVIDNINQKYIFFFNVLDNLSSISRRSSRTSSHQHCPLVEGGQDLTGSRARKQLSEFQFDQSSRDDELQQVSRMHVLAHACKYTGTQVLSSSVSGALPVIYSLPPSD